ncbi:MAG: gamma-glutamylcyclotransferase [Pirellulaceae bacterium]
MAPCGFFVYGTLQCGHLRQSAWPLPPDRIEPAMVRAVLYDLGPFPALLEGDDWVAGELWHYQPNHLPRVAQALDRVEGWDPLGNSEIGYRRDRCEVVRIDSQMTLEAYTYWFLPNRLPESAQKIAPWDRVATSLVSRWPAPWSNVPKTLEDEHFFGQDAEKNKNT